MCFCVPVCHVKSFLPKKSERVRVKEQKEGGKKGGREKKEEKIHLLQYTEDKLWETSNATTQ